MLFNECAHSLGLDRRACTGVVPANMPPSAPHGARVLTSQLKGGASRAWSSSCAQRGRSSGGGDAEPMTDVGARPVVP